jgi:hypothetical protein
MAFAGWVAWTLFLVVLTVRAGVPPLWKTWASKAWVEVPCDVVRSQVEEGPRRSRGRRPLYEVHVVYRYAFGGRVYTSTREAFEVDVLTRSEAEDRVTLRYAKGARRVCYVDPVRPEEAVLDRALKRMSIIRFISLFLCSLGTMPFAVLAFGGARWPTSRAVPEPRRGRRSGSVRVG